jgi:DNA-binding CsgD family transcriptional regulator
MHPGYHALTEKEKQTLRLLLAGHDAKSMARQLGLSVHTVNERLRYARRKLSASSSREAARLLAETEAPHPQSFGDKALGDVPAAPPVHPDPAGRSLQQRRRFWTIGGLAMISLTLAMLALASTPQATPDRTAPSATAPASDSAAVTAARAWLGLVDAGKWPESFAATTRSFQTLNTLQMWQSASEQARVPLGRVVSRTAISEDFVPAAPDGQKVIRFRTDFANKAGAVETVSLAREGEDWKIVGIYID